MDNKQNQGQGPTSFCNGHDSLCDEESFVVLGDTSGQFMNSLADVSPTHNTTSGYSGNTSSRAMVPMKQSSGDGQPSLVSGLFTTDVSPEEIQKKLNEVLQENVSLKETLYQNNLAMKQQLTTLGTWQAEVAKLHQNHKEKFSETRELILKLRTENDDLKRSLKESSLQVKSNGPAPTNSTLIAANASLVKRVEELQNQISVMSLSAKNEQQVLKSMPTKKEQELLALTEKLNRQLEIAERSRRQLGGDVERLDAQKTRLEREMTAMRSDLEAYKEKCNRAGIEIQKLQHMCVSKESESEWLKTKLQEQEAVISELRSVKETSVQPSPNNDLKTCLDNEQKRSDKVGVSLATQASLESSDTLGWVNLMAGKLGSEASGDSARVEELQNKVKELQKMLEDEQALGRERMQMVSEGQEQFKGLFEQYQDALKRLEESKKSQSSDTHRNSYYEVQVRGFTEKIDCMTAQILKLEDDILRKNQKIAELEMKNKDLETDNESIPILRMQMEVYQSDFNAEREARENMAGEKERLAEDLRLLQQRNQRLLSELKVHQHNGGEQQNVPSANSGWYTISNPQRNHARENTPPSPGPFDN